MAGSAMDSLTEKFGNLVGALADLIGEAWKEGWLALAEVMWGLMAEAAERVLNASWEFQAFLVLLWT